MPKTIISPNAIEGSTFIISVTFYNELNVATVPNTAKWSLSDLSGNIINGRVDQEIAGLTSTVSIVLSGLDLALPEGVDSYRILTITATYDSILEDDLTLVDQVTFLIKNLV
jgi:hypothetical protein